LDRIFDAIRSIERTPAALVIMLILTSGVISDRTNSSILLKSDSLSEK